MKLLVYVIIGVHFVYGTFLVWFSYKNNCAREVESILYPIGGALILSFYLLFKQVVIDAEAPYSRSSFVGITSDGSNAWRLVTNNQDKTAGCYKLSHDACASQCENGDALEAILIKNFDFMYSDLANVPSNRLKVLENVTLLSSNGHRYVSRSSSNKPIGTHVISDERNNRCLEEIQHEIILPFKSEVRLTYPRDEDQTESMMELGLKHRAVLETNYLTLMIDIIPPIVLSHSPQSIEKSSISEFEIEFSLDFKKWTRFSNEKKYQEAYFKSRIDSLISLYSL